MLKLDVITTCKASTGAGMWVFPPHFFQNIPLQGHVQSGIFSMDYTEGFSECKGPTKTNVFKIPSKSHRLVLALYMLVNLDPDAFKAQCLLSKKDPMVKYSYSNNLYL